MPPKTISFQPSSTYEEALHRAASVFGVEPEYWDIWGQRHEAPDSVQRKLLEALGVQANSREALDRAVEDRLWRQWSRLLPQTLVVGEESVVVELSVPEAHLADKCSLELRWEDGGSIRAEFSVSSLHTSGEALLRGVRFVKKELPLRWRPKLGYHELHVRLSSGEEATSRLVICPERAYLPEFLQEGGRAGGLGIALYGLKSERNWGCGDFTDLRNLIDWVKHEIRADFIGLNPLHALANRHPYNTSPYLPLSSLYRNHIYLDVERVPDFRPSGAPRFLASSRIQHEIASLRSAEFIEYERVSALKLRFLRICFRSFLQREYGSNTERARDFMAYVEREGENLERYATYRALDEFIHKQNPEVWLWTEWPEEYQDPESEAVREFSRRHWRAVWFHKYIQWQIAIQLEEVQRYALASGMRIGLYHDLALATDRWGCDLWSNRRFYAAGCRVGAPPDAFAPNGQDWGFPPPNSTAHWEDGYRLFRDSIRKNAANGGALRIDHVMRFFHLYWIPTGCTAKEGGYVLDRHHDLIRILALESVRGKFLVVGEDLGTVADFIRESLEKFGILTYRLFYFEKRKDGALRMPSEYPRRALVSATTHDLPTLAGFWTGADIELRARLGLIPDEESRRQRHAERAEDRQKMLDALHALGLLPNWFPRRADQVPELTGELHNAIVGFLASTPSDLFLLNQEDLLKQPDQQNLPGTTAEYPNWRRRMAFSIEELWRVPYVGDCAAMLRHWLEKTGRVARTI